MLARLGLRANEIVSLTLEDIDWHAGRITVHGKGNHLSQLPLPANAGEALTDYLCNGRPLATSRAVFLREKAPVAGFEGHSAISEDDRQVQSALERIAEELANHLEELESIRILGPAPCLIERIKGQYRHHLIVKNLMGETGQRAIAGFFKGRPPGLGVRLTIDVDPVDLI